MIRATARPLAGLALAALALAGCKGNEKTQLAQWGVKETVQSGERGTGMEQVYDMDDVNVRYAATNIPTSLPPAGTSPPGPLPWKNVQVLNDISVAEFNRTMVAFSTWVAGTGNCAYCHNVANFSADTLNDGTPIYTKLVARRMIQMTRHINGQYSAHVKNTGVTCYTCHRGKPLPNGLWFYGDQDDYLRHYLDRDGARVISQTEGPTNANRSSVKQTEYTYALMISMSKSLNVNCTYCHNSRAFSRWEQSPPARVTAYHGIYMVRDLNQNYLSPLRPVYPAVRLGPMGDAPKAQCLTCHNNAYKPLYGAQMTKDYPAVWGRSEWNGVPFPAFGAAIAATAPEAAPAADSAAAAAPAAAPTPAVDAPPPAPAAPQGNAQPRTNR
ncbi:MAG: photosynthetic reaction center cytochrome PufC [Gemmatimonadaceae bacterium]|jgi:photosynthetic reaction center cytochrome c subunit|nr:photosynthetic reaction center cytochrome PufC [Gemmatimonadaceae bacterium]